MQNPALHDQAKVFFDSFVTAFQSFSGEQIAALYCVPSIALHDDGTLGCLRSRADVGHYFQGVVDSYYSAGCRSCRYRDLDVLAMGSRSALGTVTWDLLLADGSVLKTWRESYNLVLGADGFQVFASTDHVE